MDEGRRVVITGASRGLGSELARRFLELGDRVWTLARTPAGESARPTAAPHSSLRASAVDITDLDQVRDAALEILEEWYVVDILVNNAGVAVFESLAATGDAELDSLVATNLIAPFRLTRFLLDGLTRARGCVVNITSSSAVRSVAGRPASAYAMTKGGLETLTRALAQELGQAGIRVNAVAPGTMQTSMTEKVIEQVGIDRSGAAFPLGRIGRPRDVVGAVEFLTSPAASWITGAVLRVDGGFTVG